MTDSPTYDAHDPVEWTPDHVAKNMDAKATDAKANAKATDAKANAKEKGAKDEAKGWAGLPID
jgi:hypothetical protein